MELNNRKKIAVWVGLNAGGIFFLAAWAYGIASNDWLPGLLFGWIPALIMGVIAGLIVFAFVYGLSMLGRSNSSRSEGPGSDPTAGITSS